MFVLRESQIEAMRGRARAGFVARVVDFLQSEHADRLDGLAGTALRDRVAGGVARARSYGIVVEADVVRFVLVDLALGRDFEAAPSADGLRRLLADPALVGGEKARRLRDLTLKGALEGAPEASR